MINANLRLVLCIQTKVRIIVGCYCTDYGKYNYLLHTSIVADSYDLAQKNSLITHLLSYDREHLQFNSVELIEAGPCSSTG